MMDKYIKAARIWYESNREKTGAINTNVMTTGLIMSRMLAGGLPIDDERLYSKNKSQVRGLSGSAIAKILKEHGENRIFTREGGRTSRNTINLAVSLRNALNDIFYADSKKNITFGTISHALEEFFLQCVRIDFFDKQRIPVDIDTTKPVSSIVTDILLAASERSDKPTGAVLQHLVGAKLELRFPDEEIGYDQANAADMQTGREGDFQVGTTAFHVTTAPMERLIIRCIENKRAGYRPIILTLDNKIQAARQMADNIGMADQISVQSAEFFIGNNIEEIAVYDGNRIREGVARLIKKYNNRIDLIESDKSLKIEMPDWMEREFPNIS